MAYITSETTKKIRDAIKAEFPKFKFKVSKRDNIALNVTVLSGDIDLNKVPENYYSRGELLTDRGECFEVSQYWLESGSYTPEQVEFYKKVIEIIKVQGEWFDKSDSMSDYFHTAFYFYIKVGEYQKPYIQK